jgi:hypothetical protein
MIMKLTSVYIILQSNIAPCYQVAMVSTLLVCIVYVISANAMVRWKKLLSNQTIPIDDTLSIVKCVTDLMQPYIKDKL